MRAGKLRHQVQIQQNTPTQNARGGTVDNWTAFGNPVWASINPTTGREGFDQMTQQAEISHEVRIRYTAGVTAAHRILFGTRVFDIQAVLNAGERDKELRLLCLEEYQ